MSASGRAAQNQGKGWERRAALCSDSRTRAGELRRAAASVTLRGQKSEQVSPCTWGQLLPAHTAGRLWGLVVKWQSGGWAKC